MKAVLATVFIERSQGQGKGVGHQYRGIPPSEVAVAAMKALENDEYEVAVGQAQGLRMAAASGNADQLFRNMNRW